MILGGIAGGITVAVVNVLALGRPFLAITSGIISAVVYAAMAVWFPPRR